MPFARPGGDARAIVCRVLIAAVLFGVWAYIARGNSRGLDVTRVEIGVGGLPGALDGLRIAQVSDFHSSRFGPGQRELLDEIAAFRPDVIAVTGDFIDGVEPDEAPCLELARGLVSIAPTYFIRGNHEYYLDTRARLKFEAALAQTGVVLLNNRSVPLERNGVPFLLSGMDDVSRRDDSLKKDGVSDEEFAMETAVSCMDAIVDKYPPGDHPLKIMLCHQPHYWSLWGAEEYDLALCGHLHGWIARLPRFGCLLRNPSIYFPEEDAGLYAMGNLRVYISRGLDNLATWRNFRLNNKPELSLFEIRGESSES